ncbi:MAG: CobW family GTP-binding protein [Bacillota bacterium]|nr:CobW family GTP-binding protein [Bacillota bacterium]
MTKIDIFSGFLGAGKTTLIKKLVKEAYAGEKVVIIENEFGEIGIDGGFLKEAGIEITEMNSGCICCSLVGDFGEALKKVLTDINPDRILIEPSGVGKLSDVISAARGATEHGAILNSFTTIVDANKCKMYMKNFGEFFNDQIEHAGCIILSHTGKVSDEKIESCVQMLHEHNKNAVIVTTSWEKLSGGQLLEAMERTNSLENELEDLTEKSESACPVCGHHHHDDECEHDEHHHHHDCECDHDEHHHHHDDECTHDEHHHHDDECEHDEHHHHDDECENDEHHHHDCECAHDEHHHEHHHHADDVFTSWGVETTHKFTSQSIEDILLDLQNSEKYGMVLRAKGIVDGGDGGWIHFDYIPGEPDVRTGDAAINGRLCVIGSKINKEAVAELFGV